MALPLQYNVKSAFVRRGATVLTLTAIAFSVAACWSASGLPILQMTATRQRPGSPSG